MIVAPQIPDIKPDISREVSYWLATVVVRIVAQIVYVFARDAAGPANPNETARAMHIFPVIMKALAIVPINRLSQLNYNSVAPNVYIAIKIYIEYSIINPSNAMSNVLYTFLQFLMKMCFVESASGDISPNNKLMIAYYALF